VSPGQHGSARDIGAPIVAWEDNAGAQGETIELGGPDAMSLLEVVGIAESMTVGRLRSWALALAR
jgi:uncharacterized protein YbjT (DUF2867 family)